MQVCGKMAFKNGDLEELAPKVSICLGLSEYEAKVFVSLIVDGASEAGKLSVRCGVPRTKIYATLKKLIEKELIVKLVETPWKFAARSPADGFEQYLSNFKEMTSNRVISLIESGKVVSFLEEAYKKTHLDIEQRKEEILIIQGRVDVLRKTGEMMARAKKSVDVVTTENGLVLFYKSFFRLIDKVVENGVNIQIRTRVNSKNEHIAHELNYVCKVTSINFCPPLLVLCVDERETLLATLIPDNFDADSNEDFGFMFQNSDVCGLISLLLPKSTGDVLSCERNEAPELYHSESLNQHIE
jgi:sugar-specific transcriptional regulator TrmB